MTNGAICIALIMAVNIPGNDALGVSNVAQLPVVSGEPLSAVRDKMERIIVPEIEFEDVPVKTVLDYLRRQAKALDGDGIGINVFYRCKKRALTRRVTVSFTNMPLDAAFDTVCEGAGLSCIAEDYAVVITDKASSKRRK